MLCEEIDMKLYIIANRLPVKVADTNGTFVFSRSEGGLATGLDSLQTSYEKHWIVGPEYVQMKRRTSKRLTRNYRK